MAYFKCNFGTELPKKLTITGAGYTSFSGGRFDNANNCSSEASGNTSITIPTLGYKKADITATSSSVGIGNNIDVSAVTSIDVKVEYKVTPWFHVAYKYWLGNTTGTYTVVLHN